MTLEDEQLARDRAALERLVAKYDLRWGHDASKRYPVKFDFIGEGWSSLLEELILEMIDLGWNRKGRPGEGEVRRAALLHRRGHAKMFAAIDRAERRSLRVCDRCGKRGRRRR